MEITGWRPRSYSIWIPLRYLGKGCHVTLQGKTEKCRQWNLALGEFVADWNQWPYDVNQESIQAQRLKPIVTPKTTPSWNSNCMHANTEIACGKDSPLSSSCPLLSGDRILSWEDACAEKQTTFLSLLCKLEEPWLNFVWLDESRFDVF